MTQPELLLRFLQSDGASITSYEAYARLQITQLGRVIDDLQKAGHRFNKEPEEHNGKHFKRYSLVREPVQLKLSI